VIGKNARIPAKFTIGRNVTIANDVSQDDLVEYGNNIPNGKKVAPDKKGRD